MVKRRFAYLVSAFLALSCTFGALAAPGDPAIIVARLSGTVEVSHPKQTTGKWQAAKQGQSIGLGWKLRTGKGGKVQLTFPKNNTVILKENSVLYVDKLDAGGGGKLLTDKGGLLVQLKNALTPGSKFEVDTPAALATVRGTEFAVLLDPGDAGMSQNSGNTNTGERNSGNVNTGDLNSGNTNTGDRNSGNTNTGERNGGAENGQIALETIEIAHEGLKMQSVSGGGSEAASETDGRDFLVWQRNVGFSHQATILKNKSYYQQSSGDESAGDDVVEGNDGKNDSRYFKSRSGNVVVLDDKDETGRKGGAVGAPKKSFADKLRSAESADGLTPSGFVPRPMAFNLVQIGDLDQDGLDDFMVQFASGPRQTTSMDSSRHIGGWEQATRGQVSLEADLDGDGSAEEHMAFEIGDVDGDGQMDFSVRGDMVLSVSGLHGKNPQPTRVMALDADALASSGAEGDPLKEEAHFKEVTGLDVYIDTLEIHEGGVNTGAHKRPGGVRVATGDLDGDGAAETVQLVAVNDLDGDGVPDWLVEPEPASAAIRNPGRANGGIASRFGALSDADGDGAVDALDPDSDGDGMIDLAVGDINGDGVIDHAFPHADVDGDGLVDLVVLTGFSNGEIPNQERKAAHDIAMNAIRNMKGFAAQPTVGDLDGDGRADLVVGDFDGDGHADLIDLSGSSLDSRGKTEWLTAIGLPKITPKIAKESHGKFRTIPDLDGDGSPEEIATGGAQDVATGGELVLPESLSNEIKQQVAAKKMMGAPKIGEANARANDRLRNAGPVNDWPSILEDGSFEQLLAEEFLRKGASTRDSDGLVFNVVNPRVARDNHLQGAVDVLGRTLATDTDQDGLPDYLDADDDGDAIDDAEDEDVDGSGTPDARELKMWLDKNADGNIGAGELTDLEAGFRLDGSRSTDDGEVSKLAKVHGLHRGQKSRTYQDQPDSDRAGKLHPKLYQESVDPFSGAGAQGERTKETHKLDLKLYGYESTVEVRNEQGTQLLGEGQTIDVEEGSAPTPPYPSGPDAAQFRQELKDQFKDGDIPDQNDFADTIDSLVIDGDEKVAVLFNPREYNLRLQQLVEQAKVLESLAHEAAHVVQQRSGRAAGEVKHDHVYQHNQTDLEFARQQLAPILSGLSEITDAATALLAEEITTLGLNPASKNLEHNKLSESQGRLGPANGGVERPGDGDSAAGILIGLLEEIEAALGTIRVADSNASSGNLVRAADSKDSGNNENWDFGSRLQFLEQGGVVIVLDGVDLEALTAHCDQWSELLNTLGRIKVEISAAGYDSGEDIAATSSTSGILPSPMGGLAERRFKWMAPENLGQFQGQVGQQLGELENMRQRINELEAKLQNLGLLARTAGGETTAPTDLGAEELARAQDDLQRTGSIVQLQLRSLRNLAEAELAYVTGVDPARLDELGSSTSSTQRAQDHNSSRSNKTASGIATDGSGGDDDDDGDGRAQDHNSSRSNKTASGIATDESGGDDDDDGDGRAQDHNSSRSNKTANGMATDGSGGEDDDDGDGRAQDHNSSRSNKTASSQPEIIDNTKGQLLRFFSDLIAMLVGESDSGEISVPPIAPDPSNEGLKEHLDLWADCGRSSRSLQAQLEQLVIAGRGGETGRPEFDTAPYESSLGAIESQLADSEQAGSGQVIEIIARITTLNEAADALLTTRDDFLPALREYANTYALYSLQKGARQQSDGADTPSGKNIGLLISEVKGQSDAANDFMEQVKLIVPIAMEKELRARRNQENDTQDVGDTSNKDYATDPYVETSQRYASDPYSEDLLRLVQHFVSVLDRLAALDAQFGQYQAQVEVRGWDPKTKQAIVGSANKFERISQEWERYETHEQTTQLKFLWVQVLQLHEELHDIYEDFGDAVGLKAKEKANRTKCSSNLRTLPPVGFDTAQGELLPANIELPAVQNELLPAVQSELLPAVQEWVEAVIENDAQIRALHERMEEMQDDIDPLISSNEELQDQLRGLIDPGDPVLGTRFENMDTDNDGLSDVAEIALGLDPLASNDDGFIELVEPEDGERIPADTDMVSFAFEPLDTDQQVDYRLVLEGAGQQLVRGNIRERMEVSIEDLRAAFPDSDGDGESEFEWFIEGRYTMFDRSGRPVRITSERRQAILESPVTSRVIIDIDAASGLQRLGGDILIHGSISEVNSLGEWEIRVAYDPSVLQFERGRKLGIFSPATVFFGEQAGGVVVISGSAPRGSGGISGEGEIFELQFTAIAAEDTVVEGQDAALSDTTGQEIEADFGNQADLSISGGGAAGVGRGQFDEKFR